jgi:L-iditol 2-dehydrogenase
MKGLDNLCPSVGVLGFNLDGGFAEMMAIPKGCVDRGGVNPVPDGLGSDVASLAEPLACCINAQDSLGVGRGDSVAIIGGGPLGALHAMLARHRGANMVAVVETEAPRRAILAHVDPDMVVDPKEGWHEIIREAQQGQGVDAILMATSAAPIDQGMIGLLAPRGRLSIFSGLARESSVTSVDLNQLHYWERSMVGSYGCRSADCKEALALLANRSVDADWLITKRLALDRILQGLAYAESRRGMKATVTGF